MNLISQNFDNCSLRYGPQFPCLVCHGVCFLHHVSPARGVQGLQTEEGQQRFLDKRFIFENIEMFTALDTEWICTTCKSGVDNDSLPQMAAKNGLSNTWAALPSSLLNLKREEQEVVSTNHLFLQIDDLKLGVIGRRGTQKSIFLPLEDIQNAPSIAHVTRDPKGILALHARPQDERPVVRLEVVLDAVDHLSQFHPAYPKNDYFQLEYKEYMKDTLQDLGVCLTTDERTREPGNDTEVLDHFSSFGPTIPVLQGVVLPWGKAFLSASDLQILHVAGLESQIAAIFDLENTAGVTTQREVPLSLQGWINQRLHNVHRLGPGNNAILLFSLLLQLDIEAVRSHIIRGQTMEGRSPDTYLATHPGSKAYYWKREMDLQAEVEWRGPAVVFLSLSTNAGTNDALGTWVSHQAGVEGNDVQVWHTGDEKARLTVRMGKVRPSGVQDHFVHSRTEVEDDTCPFHLFCSREPLENWRERYDFNLILFTKVVVTDWNKNCSSIQ